jgi:hypothetical protein
MQLSAAAAPAAPAAVADTVSMKLYACYTALHDSLHAARHAAGVAVLIEKLVDCLDLLRVSVQQCAACYNRQGL